MLHIAFSKTYNYGYLLKTNKPDLIETSNTNVMVIDVCCSWIIKSSSVNNVQKYFQIYSDVTFLKEMATTECQRLHLVSQSVRFPPTRSRDSRATSDSTATHSSTSIATR